MHSTLARSRPLLAALLLAGRPAAQIVTENAGVLSPELTVLRESVEVASSENLDEVRWNHELHVAPDRRDELRLSVPLLWREATFDTAGGDQRSDESGLGDVSLRWKHALWRADDVMRSQRWSLLCDVGAPTGEDDAEAGGVRLPQALQLGSGGWSFGAGSAYAWIRDRHRFALEATYQHHTRQDGFRLGDAADLNAAYWVRLVPAAFAAEDPRTEVRGVLELLGTHQFPSEAGGERADDDGTLVWLAPGIQVYPGTRALFEASLQLPILQDLDDALGDRRWSVHFVLKLLF